MAPSDTVENLPDLTGKVALVTGATSGVGFAASQLLLRKGATVYLAARNESKATGAIARLEAEGLGPGNGKPIWHKLVLDHPNDAKKSAEEFLERESRLDILVNNAALLMKHYEVGPLGISDIVTVNHLSPFVFTNSLLPLLKRTALLPDADVRIVNISSKAYSDISKTQFKEKEDFNGPSKSSSMLADLERYGFTKLMNVLWTRELQRRLSDSRTDGGSNIICISLHPGVLATEGNYKYASSLPWPLSIIMHLATRLIYGRVENGAYIVAYAAVAPEVRKEAEKFRGAYLVPPGVIQTLTKTAQDDSLARDLWDLSEDVLSENAS